MKNRNKPEDRITIVSGLPRSGTSMMMRMLEAGGMSVLVDNIRKNNDDNPDGYYEFEPVKKIREDSSWLNGAGGKAVKMVSLLLLDLPPGRRYKIIFMKRRMNEIIASQRVMLERNGRGGQKVNDEEKAEKFEKHLKKIEAWLSNLENLDVLYIDYNKIILDPKPHVNSIAHFLDAGLDVEKMIQIINKKLYRQRG